MKLQHSFLAILILALTFISGSASAKDDLGSAAPPALCLPGIYLDGNPTDCTLLGPAGYLTHIAWMEAEIASQPERFTPIDASYGESNLTYLKVNEDDPRNIYSSLDAAIEGGKQSSTLSEGFAYVSYVRQVTNGGKTFYELSDGSWIRGGAVSGYGKPNQFRGVLVQGTPPRTFGWVLNDIETRSIPGYYNNTGTDHILERHTIIEVFEVEKIGKSNWYMVAPGEWLYQTEVALIYPTSTPPEGVRNRRWIEINLHEQTVAVYDKGEMVFGTLVTTGSSRTFTRPGLWSIYEKLIITGMAGGDKEKEDYYNLKDVPWVMYFDERRALHAEYWHDHLGYRSSHGCVNLSFPDAEWMYTWADFGDWVYVWDPSGQTPGE